MSPLIAIHKRLLLQVDVNICLMHKRHFLIADPLSLLTTSSDPAGGPYAPAPAPSGHYGSAANGPAVPSYQENRPAGSWNDPPILKEKKKVCLWNMLQVLCVSLGNHPGCGGHCLSRPVHGNFIMVIRLLNILHSSSFS